MSGFGVMLSQDAENSVAREALKLAGSDIKALLLMQSKALQHVLAASSALAQRAEELDAPPAPARSTPSSVSYLRGSSETPTVLQADLEPLLAERQSHQPVNAGQASPEPRPRALTQSEACPAPFTTPEEDQPTMTMLRSRLRRSQSDLGLDMAPGMSEDRSTVALFPDVLTMQSFLKETLTKDTYAVENLYKTTGVCQMLARDERFKNLTFFLIFLNALWMGYDIDHNRADVLCDADGVAQFVENVFCTYFTFEVAVRFFAFRCKCDAFRNAWFVFDFVLVSLMVWETWISILVYSLLNSSGGGRGSTAPLRMFRLFRLTRVARLGRLINAVPELMLLVRGMAMAVRSVGSTLLLMFLIICVFSMLFTMLLRDSDVGLGKFETVPMSIDYLLVGTVFPDQRGVIQEMLNEHWVYYLCMIIYLLIGSVTVMNLLVAVLCGVVAVVAEAEKNEVMEHKFKNELTQLMFPVDSDRELEVNAEEVSQIMLHPEAVMLLDDMGIDVYALVENLDIFFQDKPTLNMDDFFAQLMLFRYSRVATQKDLLVLRRSLEKQFDSLNKCVKRMSKENSKVHQRGSSAADSSCRTVAKAVTYAGVHYRRQVL